MMGVLVVGGPRPLAAAFPLTLALSHEGRGTRPRTTPRLLGGGRGRTSGERGRLPRGASPGAGVLVGFS